jgi:arylsulfatase A-like enzyme
MRVPTIAWSPGTIPAGTSNDAICGMFDVLPSFAVLAGVGVPGDRKIDGADIRSVLMGGPASKPPHEVFFYFRGLNLQAVRDSEWKLILPVASAETSAKGKTNDNAKSASRSELFNLRTDIGETTDVAAQHPEVIARLDKLVAAMKDDLGTDGLGPGVRPIGKVANSQPLIDFDGKVRPGFEPKYGLKSNSTIGRP